MAARKTDGTFAKGHTGNPNGRPKRSTEEKYLAALSRRVPLKEWRTVCDTAIARAKAGDSTARQWLSDYLMGKPIQRTEASGPGGGPIEHKLSGSVGVTVYIPDNERGDRDSTTAGATGEVPIDVG